MEYYAKTLNATMAINVSAMHMKNEELESRVDINTKTLDGHELFSLFS
jgi:hypothetical protein